MKYLCLGYHEENKLRAMTDDQRRTLVEECREYDAMLWRNGYCLKGNALPPAAGAITLRFESGKMCVAEGPFAQTKEQLGGILLLEAKDLNHAIQLMSQLPAMRLGGALEIRPVDEPI
ncbi:MAG TPA: YciI family protein [Tepidisphaeraceae bacterium]|jgi:hypothetical protein